MALVYSGTKNWQALIDATTRGMGCTDGTKSDYTHLLERRARANLELGHVPEAEADLEEVCHKGKWGPREAAPLQAVIALWAGECEEVLKIDLPQTKAWMHRPELVAARFEAAQRLGRPDEAGELTRDHLDCLRQLHLGEWADRLAATYGRSMAGRCQPIGSRNSADLQTSKRVLLAQAAPFTLIGLPDDGSHMACCGGRLGGLAQSWATTGRPLPAGGNAPKMDVPVRLLSPFPTPKPPREYESLRNLRCLLPHLMQYD